MHQVCIVLTVVCVIVSVVWCFFQYYVYVCIILCFLWYKLLICCKSCRRNASVFCVLKRYTLCCVVHVTYSESISVAYWYFIQEAQLPQRNRATHYVSEFVHRFCDIARYWSKIADFNLPYLYFAPPLG